MNAMCVVLVMFALGFSVDLRARPSVEITPNAIQRRNEPMKIEVRNLAAAQDVSFEVVADCADLKHECDTLAHIPKQSTSTGKVSLSIKFSDFPNIPEDVPLLLRTHIQDGATELVVDTTFAISTDACTFYATVASMFSSSVCTPKFGRGLADAHWATNAVTDEPIKVLVSNEVRKLQPLRSTSTATGVAWYDNDTLIFTATRPPSTMMEQGPLQAGLYLVSIDGTHRRIIAETPGKHPEGPYVVAKNRLVFFTFEFPASTEDASAQRASLHIVETFDRNRAAPSEAKSIPLLASIEPPLEVLRLSDDGKTLLVHGRLAGNEILAKVSLIDGAVARVPYDEWLATVTRRPWKENLWPVEVMTLDSDTGRDIGVVDKDGNRPVAFDGKRKSLDLLVSAAGDQWFPTVSPDSTHIACLTK